MTSAGITEKFNLTDTVLGLKSRINEYCSGREPWEIIAATFFTTLCVISVCRLFQGITNFGGRQAFLGYLRKLPFFKQLVEKKMKSTTAAIEKEFQKGLENKVFLENIPEKSLSSDFILKEIENYLGLGKYSWDKGYVSGAVYSGNDKKLKDLVDGAYKLTAYTNPLHPDVFPGIRVMEAEIVQMVSRLFNAPNPVGTVTSGGTESIFLVCKAYRDFAKAERGIQKPNMVIPVTAHAAFEKAAHLLQIGVKKVKIDSKTMKVNVAAMKKTIDSNTCMLVASAPPFPHGCMDDIEKIAQLGVRYSVPVHVDACLGGFLLPFMKKAGFQIPGFDFSVKGVTSISVDTHKYAYAPKGTSVILYRNKMHRHYQFSVQTDWPGGIYGTPNLSGSRSGGLIATCWASLLYHGIENYVKYTREIISVTKKIDKGLRQIEGIFVYGQPELSVLAIGSQQFDVYRLSSALGEKGWNLNALQFPPGFHICITIQHTYESVADRFLSDVRECTKEILRTPSIKSTGTAAIYGMAQQIPDRSLVSEIVWAYLDACYNIKPSQAVGNGSVN